MFSRFPAILTIVLLTFSLQAQIVSHFTWDTADRLAAKVGPNATSAGANAVTKAGGVGGTRGLSAGGTTTNKVDLNYVIPNNAAFNLPSIDISYDYQRDENTATVVSRGTVFVMGENTNFNVAFTIDNGAGGTTKVTLPAAGQPAIAVPLDDIFRNYRFTYEARTGIARLLVDGVVKTTLDGPDNRNLVWTGAGNITLGTLMDGNGTAKVLLDNFIIQNYSTAVLPVRISYFRADPRARGGVDLSWETASETHCAYYDVERSTDQDSWQYQERVTGAGTTTLPTSYRTTDPTAPATGVYYRLKQVDEDGTYEYSDIRFVKAAETTAQPPLIYPNPSSGYVTVAAPGLPSSAFRLTDQLGRDLTPRVNPLPQDGGSATRFDLSGLPTGIYYVNIGGRAYPVHRR